MDEYLALAVRVSIMYLYALAIIRISGKRSIGNLSAFDFVISNMVGDLFDDVFWNEVPLSQALVAFTSLFVLHMLVSYASYKSKRMHDLVASVPAQVVKQGKFIERVLASERTPKDDVLSELRMQKEEQVEEVQEGHLEPSGQFSFIKRENDKKAQKKDLPRLKELFS